MMGDAAHLTGIAVGRFAVMASEPEAAGFQQALGNADPAAGGPLPLTYPVRWLARAELRRAIMAALGAPAAEPVGVLVHLEQRFTSHAPLLAGVPYAMAVAIDPGATPETFALRAEISGAEGLCQRLWGRFAVLAPTVSLPTVSLPDAAAGQAAPAAPMAPGGPAVALVPGQRLAPIDLPLADHAAIRAYAAASGDDNPLHQDRATAQRAGFADVLVPGLLVQGQMAECLARCLPDARIEMLEARFVLPVIAGSALRLELRVAARRADGAAILRLKVMQGAQLAVLGEAVIRAGAGPAVSAHRL